MSNWKWRLISKGGGVGWTWWVERDDSESMMTVRLTCVRLRNAPPSVEGRLELLDVHDACVHEARRIFPVLDKHEAIRWAKQEAQAHIDTPLDLLSHALGKMD